MTRYDKQINTECFLVWNWFVSVSANYNLIIIAINYVGMQMSWHLYGINYKRYLSVVLASQEHHMQLQPINISSVLDHSGVLHMNDLETRTQLLWRQHNVLLT